MKGLTYPRTSSHQGTLIKRRRLALPLPGLPAHTVGDADPYPVEDGQRSAIHFTLAGIEHQSLQPAQPRFEPVT